MNINEISLVPHYKYNGMARDFQNGESRTANGLQRKNPRQQEFSLFEIPDTLERRLHLGKAPGTHLLPLTCTSCMHHWADPACFCHWRALEFAFRPIAIGHARSNWCLLFSLCPSSCYLRALKAVEAYKIPNLPLSNCKDGGLDVLTFQLFYLAKLILRIVKIFVVNSLKLYLISHYKISYLRNFLRITLKICKLFWYELEVRTSQIHMNTNLLVR